MSTSYLVSIDLQTTGNLEGKLGAATAKTQDLHSSLGKLSSGFTAIVERAGEVALTIGKWAGAGALGAVAYGIFHINKELETTSISLASMFGANGFSKDMTQGMQMSGDILAKMRKDAAAL